MTKLIHVGIAYDSKNNRQFDFYLTDRELVHSTRELVKTAYKRPDDVSKGGEEEMKLTKEMSEAERKITEYAKKKKQERNMSSKRKII